MVILIATCDSKDRHTSMRTQTRMAQAVALLVPVVMPTSDSIASDMSGLMGRLTSFQNPQKPPWSCHWV